MAGEGGIGVVEKGRSAGVRRAVVRMPDVTAISPTQPTLRASKRGQARREVISDNDAAQKPPAEEVPPVTLTASEKRTQTRKRFEQAREDIKAANLARVKDLGQAMLSESAFGEPIVEAPSESSLLLESEATDARPQGPDLIQDAVNGLRDGSFADWAPHKTNPRLKSESGAVQEDTSKANAIRQALQEELQASASGTVVEVGTGGGAAGGAGDGGEGNGRRKRRPLGRSTSSATVETATPQPAIRLDGSHIRRMGQPVVAAEAVPAVETVVPAVDKLEATIKTLGEMPEDERQEMLDATRRQREELQKQLDAGDLSLDDFVRRDGTLEEIINADAERQRRLGVESPPSVSPEATSSVAAQIAQIDTLLAGELSSEDRATLLELRSKLQPAVSEPVSTGTEVELTENAKRAEFNAKMQALGQEFQQASQISDLTAQQARRDSLLGRLDDVVQDEAARRANIDLSTVSLNEDALRLLDSALAVIAEQRAATEDTALGRELDIQRDFTQSQREEIESRSHASGSLASTMPLPTAVAASESQPPTPGSDTWTGAKKPEGSMASLPLHRDASGLVDREALLDQQMDGFRNRYTTLLDEPDSPERTAKIAEVTVDLSDQVAERLRLRGHVLPPATGDALSDAGQLADFYLEQGKVLADMYLRERQQHPDSALLQLIDQMGAEVADQQKVAMERRVALQNEGTATRRPGLVDRVRTWFARGGPRDPNRRGVDYGNGVVGPSPEDISTLPQNTGEAAEPRSLSERRNQRLAAAAAGLAVVGSAGYVGTQIDWGKHPAETRPAGQDTDSQAKGNEPTSTQNPELVATPEATPTAETAVDTTINKYGGVGTEAYGPPIPTATTETTPETTPDGGDSSIRYRPTGEAAATAASSSTSQSETTVESTAQVPSQKELQNTIDKHTRELTIKEGSSISQAMIDAGIVKDADAYNVQFYTAPESLLGSYILAYQDLLPSNPDLPPLADTVKAFYSAPDDASREVVVEQMQHALDTVNAGAEISVPDSMGAATDVARFAKAAVDSDDTGGAWDTFNQELADAFNKEDGQATADKAKTTSQEKTGIAGDGTEVVDTNHAAELIELQSVLNGLKALQEKGYEMSGPITSVELQIQMLKAKSQAGSETHGHREKEEKKTDETAETTKKDDDEEVPIIPGGPQRAPGEVIEGS